MAKRGVALDTKRILADVKVKDLSMPWLIHKKKKEAQTLNRGLVKLMTKALANTLVDTLVEKKLDTLSQYSSM